MKHLILFAIFVLALFAGLRQTQAQGTAFTYQGRLNDGSNPAHGTYDFRFKLFEDPLGNTQMGSAVLTNGIPLTNGLFIVTIDFGAGIFNGSNYWLEVDVRTNGAGSFTTLNPLQPVTPTPYAIFANTASNVSGALASANLAGTYGNAVTFNNPVNNFAGNGSGLTGLNASQLTSGAVPTAALSNAWTTTGNSGTTPGANFVGTMDNQPLELRVNGGRAFRLEPNTAGAPNVIGGSPLNSVSNNVVGATIAGGGATNNGGGAYSNSVTASFGTVGGGLQNLVNGQAAIIGGGSNNISGGSASTIGGGALNTASGAFATVAGGNVNNSAGFEAAVGGGAANNATGDNAFIGGGYFNFASSYATTVGGGYQNNANVYYGTIGGGYGNQVAGGFLGAPTVAGGFYNQASIDLAAVGGGYNNIASGYGAVIGGGGYDGSTTAGNRAGGNASVVAGGLGNQATNHYAAIGGGQNNLAGGLNSTISGGSQNIATGTYSAVGGGHNNTASGTDALVLGGNNNTASGNFSLAAGSGAQALHQGAFVWADALGGTYSSDRNNQCKIRAAGGVILDVSGSSGLNPAALRVSSTSANGVGIFVAQTSSDATAVFTAAGTGDIIKGFNADNGGNPVFEVVNSGDVYGHSFNSTSDRNVKENFTALNAKAVLDKVLALPVTEWNYKTGPADQKHVGPMAQDFHAAFGLNGKDDKHISMVDEGGVALAAIQGLNQKLEEKDVELGKLEQQNEVLAKQLSELKIIVQTLAAKQ